MTRNWPMCGTSTLNSSMDSISKISMFSASAVSSIDSLSWVRRSERGWRKTSGFIPIPFLIVKTGGVLRIFTFIGG